MCVVILFWSDRAKFWTGSLPLKSSLSRNLSSLIALISPAFGFGWVFLWFVQKFLKKSYLTNLRSSGRLWISNCAGTIYIIYLEQKLTFLNTSLKESCFSISHWGTATLAIMFTMWECVQLYFMNLVELFREVDWFFFCVWLMESTKASSLWVLAED